MKKRKKARQESEKGVRVGWVGARALDKEKKSGKNKEKKKGEARK